MADDDRIKTAKLDWGDPDIRETPRSLFFDDIYFAGDGIGQSEHVFLGGNDLPERFQTPVQFSIGELGFGAGLNFLSSWNCWRNTQKPATARLNFLSLEKHPLTRTDLRRAHALAYKERPDLAALSAQLLGSYPPDHAGYHQLELNDGVTLTLMFGDALALLSKAEANIDTWFLDGFSPSKNPAMWQPEVMREVARLSKPNASFATYSVAGDVRRAVQSAGFSIERRPGFGTKREMLTGRLRSPIAHAPRRKPWFDTPAPEPLAPDARIAIIGAGIAGASMACSLAQAGMKPLIFEAKTPASGASGNPAGLIMPRLDADHSPTARFFVQSYLYTVQLLATLQRHSGEPIFNQCGNIFYAHNDREKEKQKKLLSLPVLPEGWIEHRADGLFFPQAGVVNPRAFVKALLGDVEIRTGKVTQLKPEGTKWRVICDLEDTDKEDTLFDAVIIANSLDALGFSQCHSLPLIGFEGQVDYFPHIKPPTRAHIFGPYIAPCFDGPDQNAGLVIGATYSPINRGTVPTARETATRSNIDAVRGKFPKIADTLVSENARARASTRCITPDWLPLLGSMPDWGFYGGAYDGIRDGRQKTYPQGQTLPGLYVFAGLGSRGLVTAPYCASILAAQITGAPPPIDLSIAEALHPARFFMRELKKTKPGNKNR